ncbi:hypothetical protein [Mucilaginibacter lacusdianchii]|uniref:hypothetical protein n=1 Tax=Mucilaginibacter lacusdianchii TaxID=2684211 RepID=UPI00131B3FBD|nr:hypothetical protein [Mucilaginibacter sp. JXJ CY 39]
MKYKITPFAIVAIVGIGIGVYVFASSTFIKGKRQEGDVYLTLFGVIVTLFSAIVLLVDRLAIRQLKQHFYSIAFTELALIAIVAIFILLH